MIMEDKIKVDIICSAGEKDKIKIKITADFICSVCEKPMFVAHVNDRLFIICLNDNCENRNKLLQIPEIEVKKYENRDSEKQD